MMILTVQEATEQLKSMGLRINIQAKYTVDGSVLLLFYFL